MNITLINKPVSYEVLRKNENFNIHLIENINNDSEFNILDNNTKLVFINIDSSLNKDGSCNIDNIKNSIHKIRNISFNEDPSIFLISKVPPGICNELGCHYLPILNSENITDVIDKILVGINYNDPFAENTMKHIQDFFTNFKDKGIIKTDQLLFIKNKELEILEITKQGFFATKIAYFSEINEYCNKLDIDYRKIRQYLSSDQNIGDSYNNILGTDNKPGFSGHSMMKNLLFLSDDIKRLGNKSYIVDNVIKRNIKKDRPVLDWLQEPNSETLIEEVEKLKTSTLSELNLFCSNNNIDINDCVERIDVINKIVAFKKSNFYNIPIINDSSTNTQTNDNIPNIIPTAFNMRQSINPNISNNTNNNNPPNNTNPTSFQPPGIQGQSGVPMQINQPPPMPTQNINSGNRNQKSRKPMFRPGGRNLLNMNVRSNNAQMWGTTRPGTRSGGGGGIRFGGGVQR